ncbi:PepSY domain-containing protein [Alteromonas gilva]|uniref:PepSY domain-containing protein n=1 Tax=Alteromonas gilva TaxID=2987522 RepID=A0ABT5L7L0_9ALTE|nr:PepSY domain-containing protein [Alteromonas gilva]MDC8831743.1 PepSY domain-containing protein [Alteromonas gilva]
MFRAVVMGSFLVLLAASSNPAVAQQNQKVPVTNSTQAAQQAKRHIEGRVLKVDKQKSSYRVKMLKKSGRVVTLDVDKRSGKVKPSKTKDDN